MASSLLDLSDDVLLMICEEIQQNTFSHRLSSFNDLRTFSYANRRLRTVAQPHLWERLTFNPSRSNPDLNMVTLSPHLWSMIKYFYIETRNSFSSFLYITAALAFAKNIKRVYLVTYTEEDEQDFAFEIPTVITNALRSCRAQKFSIGHPGDFEDGTFNFSDMQNLEDLDVYGETHAGLLLDEGGPPKLKALRVRRIHATFFAELLLWSFERVEELCLGIHLGPDIFIWTHEVLENLNHALPLEGKSERPVVRLRSLSFEWVADLFQEEGDAKKPSSREIFEYLATIPLDSLAFSGYGAFHWDLGLSQIKFRAVKKLSLGAPGSSSPSEGKVCALDDPEFRQNLQHFLASFPSLEVLNLHHWTSSYDLKIFCDLTEAFLKHEASSLKWLLDLVAAKKVHTLNLRNALGDEGDYEVAPDLPGLPPPLPSDHKVRLARAPLFDTMDGITPEQMKEMYRMMREDPFAPIYMVAEKLEEGEAQGRSSEELKVCLLLSYSRASAS
ncbi:hypothetical protein P7C70_g4719, partial [Phenoliferia sp. Uapishka_3]